MSGNPGFQFHMGDDKEELPSWTNEIHFSHKVASWKSLLALGKAFYDKVRADDRGKNKAESDDGNCLTATLYYPHQNGCILFQSTIPRGKLRDEMMRDGASKASQWWAANSTNNRAGPEKRYIHAEDGVEYLLFKAQYERQGTTAAIPPQEAGSKLRLVVYGKMMSKTQPGKVLVFGKVFLCYGAHSKIPNCEEVAEKLHISYLPRNKTAEQQDELEAQQAPQQQQQQQQQPRPASSSSESSNSFIDVLEQSEFRDGTLFAGDGSPARKPKQARTPQPQGRGDKSMDQLNKSMSNLSMGGRGIAPPRPQVRPPRGPGPKPGPQATGRSEGRPSKPPAAKDPRENRFAGRERR